MDNTSGGGQNAYVPREIAGWNWGAFLLTWIWGIGNRTYIAFLAFIPFFGLVMPFVLGAKGSAWAWQARHWDSIEDFRSTQRQWALWGVVAWVAVIGLAAAGAFAIMAMMKDSDAYRLGVSAFEADAEATALVGAPFMTGIPQGRVHVSGPDGDASLSFGVEGPEGEGKVFIEATRSMGRWQVDAATFEQDGTGRRIDLAD